ncbi:AmpG family muropeptide MFS transporter [Oculatella sp. LEGE 06141]|uniref:AmpG family muropeptide MFS transporter n=1 Tax=Oculatella sp. LEGE 06141 TaxID=1828648 RepID=UPI001882C774|nr:AmpG family muropeptide MFS transporter [Oculatella sp. LEGE 06141]MBE9180885.1 AmpG family muropeptide MFS transporter [Oculatella sp. LEGE 06141]
MNRETISLESGIEEQSTPLQSPWLFVPTLYFAAGVPYIIVNTVSVVLYKKLGIDNAQIALWTSLLYLPWVIKMLWGPLIDIYSTKRRWILYTQCAMTLCLGALALSLQLANFFVVSLLVLAIAAFISATQDIATDGFYMLALDQDAQAFFVGIRSTFYRIAMIFGIGLLVFLAGQLEESLHDRSLGWTIAFGLAALVFAILVIVHWLFLPLPQSDANRSTSFSVPTFYGEVITTYFKQEKIWAILAFIFLYRIGEAMLVKLAPPFLLDAPQSGGLGLSTSQVGLVYGTLGSLALTVGGILGGWLVYRYGVKRSLIPMAIALNLPHLFYVYLAYTQPSIHWVYPLVAIEQFGYGLGTAAYSVYFMYIANERYKTSHFAISTGIMALGMMLPGLVSGYIQQALGYQLFFVVVFLLTIPGMLTLFFIPLGDEN